MVEIVFELDAVKRGGSLRDQYTGHEIRIQLNTVQDPGNPVISSGVVLVMVKDRIDYYAGFVCDHHFKEPSPDHKLEGA